jgi:hypothetical protein
VYSDAQFKQILLTKQQTLNRNPPFGNKVLDAAAKFPLLKMTVSQVKDLSHPTQVELYIQIGLENAGVVKMHGKKGSYAVSFLANTSDQVFISHRRIFLSKLKEGESFRVMVTLTKPSQTIVCSLISENFGNILLVLNRCLINGSHSL